MLLLIKADPITYYCSLWAYAGFDTPAFSSNITEYTVLTDGEIDIMTLLVKCGLAPSNKQARQLVEQGGVFVNDEKVSAPTMLISREMLADGVKIRKGKKIFHKAVLA